MAFTVVPACRLAGLPIAALSIEGFRGLVTSSTTPIATGRSDCCQAGLNPAENPRLFTTHAKDQTVTSLRRDEKPKAEVTRVSNE